MSERAVYAVMDKESYDAVMNLVADLSMTEEHQWMFEEFPAIAGFHSGYGIHAADCCGAFDRMLAADGYVKNEGGGI